MTPRVETWLWIAQRATALVLSVAVTAHIITIIVAVRGGLTAAEILARVQNSTGWLVFYTVFVMATAVHAPIGIRTILAEHTRLPAPAINTLALLFCALTLVLGLRAAWGLFGS